VLVTLADFFTKVFQARLPPNAKDAPNRQKPTQKGAASTFSNYFICTVLKPPAPVGPRYTTVSNW
jgi:hypothetical protein